MASRSVDPRILDQAFATFMSKAGVNPKTSLNDGLRALIDFYSNVRVEGCDPGADQDMLLFQWGTYDWGEGEHFELDLVRQIMIPDEEDDDAIWQLHLTYRYPASADLSLVGSGNRWCASLGEADDFVRFVFSAPPVVRVLTLPPARPEISYECAG
jgi:hypothetical protein